MTDDSTRTGIGQGSKTNVAEVSSRRVQVRMLSGKIYGPYQRQEVVAFIQAKKIHGEEHILVEGTSDWKPITSDPQFFDALQETLFGGGKKSKGTPPENLPEREEGTRTVASPKAPLPEKSPKTTSSPKVPTSLELELPSFEPQRARPIEMSASLSDTSEAKPDSPLPPKNESKKTSPRALRLLFLGVVVGLVAYFVFTEKGDGVVGRPANQALLSPIASPLVYAKPLAVLMEDLKFAIPPVSGKLTASDSWNFPEGLGAHLWIADLQKLNNEDNLQVRSSAAYWVRWAWDLEWLGATVSAFDSGKGRSIRREGERIFERLVDEKLVPPSVQTLFKSIPLLADGKWDEVTALLSPVKELEFAQWLAEESSWWAFWSKGGGPNSGKVAALVESYSSSALDAAAHVRQALFEKDPSFADLLDELAARDPKSSLLWLASGEYYWRIAADQVQRANGRFAVGLAAISLLPSSFQEVYWQQYAEFLSSFGRQVTAQRGVGNYEILKKGTLSSAGAKWWDFNQEGLELSKAANDIFSRATTGPLAETDIAVFQVIGPALPQGADALGAAGYHLVFEEEWARAITTFESALRIDHNHVASIGGLIWANSNLYKFEKAFALYDRLTKIPGVGYEAGKYNALIHMYGREFEDSTQTIDQYVKSVPNDPWGHYFSALNSLRKEKNVDCVRAASLARVHATGEFKQRATLLFFKCRILAEMNVTDALNNLRALYAATPRAVPIALALTEAQLKLDLADDALIVAEETLSRYPRSYKLRIRMGEIYEQKRDYDRAVAFYNKATKEKSDSADALIHIARVYEHEDKPLEAAQNYETAAHLNPDYPEIYIMAARAYAKANKWKEAIQLYKREVEERPAVLSSFIEAAEFFLNINAPDEVLEIFKRYKEGEKSEYTPSFDSDPRVLTRIAQAYWAKKETDKARMAATTALGKDPTIPEPYRILAVMYEQEGQYELSKQNYLRYLNYFPQASNAKDIEFKISRPPFTP